MSFRQFRRGLFLFPAMLIYLAHGFLVVALYHRLPVKRRAVLIENVRRYSAFALRLLNIEVETRGLDEGTLERERYLLVSNHLSYVDMMVLSTVSPAVFVTSVDMGQVPFLGQMAEVGGSLFIERRHRERIGYDIEQIAGVLNQGFHVMLFPEGTSTDGSAVLPFKRSLLTAAVQAGKKILPLTLRYEEVDGQPFGPKNRDNVCWYGKMSFLPHLMRLMNNHSVRASVTFHEPMSFAATTDKDVIARTLHQVVAEGSVSAVRQRQSEGLEGSSTPRPMPTPAYKDVPHSQLGM